MSSLTCPKCHGEMRQYERNGVHVDQCSDCRGIFLDRGELERLVDAERAWSPSSSGQQSQQSPQYDQQTQAHPQSQTKPKKRRSFLEDLFE